MATALAFEATQQVKRQLVTLVVRILRPLARILLRNGMSCQEFTEIARWTYVDVAMKEKEFALQSRSKQFKSRAAVITGLSRKEVLRLLELGGIEGLQEMEPSNRAARVLRGWTDNPLFRTSNGPKDLPLKGRNGSFHELVRLYSGDVPPRAVLDELRRCGAVEIIDGDTVRYTRFSYSAGGNSVEELEAVEVMAGNLLETLDRNLREPASGSSQLPWQGVSSSKIPESSADALRIMICTELERTARKVNDFVAGHEEKTKRTGKSYRNAGVGLFYYES